MATELDTTKPRLVKAGQTFVDFDADKAAAFTSADGRKLRSGQDKMRALEDANAALKREQLNLQIEFAERNDALTVAHAAHVARIMSEG
jgi:hypothetical protein